MKRITHITGLAAILSAAGCKQPVQQQRLPPPFERRIPTDGRFEDLIVMAEGMHKLIRIDYEAGKVMISYTHDPRRGDIILIFPEKQKERSIYLDEKYATRILRRCAQDGKEDPLFLEEEKQFNTAYEWWADR